MKLNTSVILQIVRKEFLHIRRGHMLFLLLVPPVLQTIVFGFVVTTEVKHIPLLVVDRDRSAQSRLLTRKFSNTDYFDVRAVTSDARDIQAGLTRNQVKAALLIPEDFSRDIKRGRKARLQLIADGSDPNTGGIAVNYGTIIISEFSGEVFGEKMRQLEAAVGGIPGLQLEERVWFNPELKSVNTMIPGVIGMSITFDWIA
jgi:ABC-2 type transport system permease protein